MPSNPIPINSVIQLKQLPWVMLAVVFLQVPSVPRLLADETIDFDEQIRPIFNKHCTACHGGVTQAGDLSFVYRDHVVPPNGWVVEPGDPEASLLIERVLSTDDDERMPPPEHGPALKKQEIDLLKSWIVQGAHWTDHWAYESPSAPPLPETGATTWSLRPLDHFVLHRLQQEKLSPAADESPERWLRRVSFDLTGLPPAPALRKRFLKHWSEDRNQACEHAVDAMMDSPQFGERWASVWLDQVRYADSKGLGLDSRRNIWKYRDWVIDAINEDLPYDQFSVKQIAGDLLPDASMEDLLATAAHRLTQSNEEGGTDDEEFRISAVLDRVNTVWQTWQGITFGCTQCHSHPYEPFEQKDYYRFAAFFNNTRDSDLNEEWPTVNVPIDRSEYPAAAALDHQIRDLNHQVWTQESKPLFDDSIWTPTRLEKVSTNNETRVVIESQPEQDEFHTVDTVTKNTDITVQVDVPPELTTLSALRLTVLPLHPEKAIPDSEWGFVLAGFSASLNRPDQDESMELELVRAIGDEPDPFQSPQESLNLDSNKGFSAYSRIHYPRRAAFVLKQPVSLPEGSSISITLKHRTFMLGAFPLVSKRGRVDLSSSSTLQQLLEDQSLASKRDQLDELRANRRAIASTATPVLAERPPRFERPTHVFIRGLFLTKDEKVAAGTPASLHPLETTAPPTRLDLAKWIASNENPLTARVAVNRVWARLFGIGLVSTEEDFGSSGERPSHPELLDHLAVQFQNDFSWSLKRLIREIVLSRTYRQSSVLRESLADRDPQNRLLARGPRHRLSAEMVRDQALMLAGLLSEKMHGPPVHPPIPEGVWKPFSSGDKWTTPDAQSGERYRRSIYTYTKRSIPFPMYAAFDLPSREFCTPRRLRSNTPLQALMTLNDQTFVECSQALGERIRAMGSTPDEQLAGGFEWVVNRPPTASELKTLVDLFEKIPEADRYPIVAGTLLNLDEVLTK